MLPWPRSFSAAERRKNVATAEGRGNCSSVMSRVAAKESFAATRLITQTKPIHGLQPWLHSNAAAAADARHNARYEKVYCCQRAFLFTFRDHYQPAQWRENESDG